VSADPQQEPRILGCRADADLRFRNFDVTDLSRLWKRLTDDDLAGATHCSIDDEEHGRRRHGVGYAAGGAAIYLPDERSGRPNESVRVPGR
jgi:hypothetical protein